MGKLTPILALKLLLELIEKVYRLETVLLACSCKFILFKLVVLSQLEGEIQ